MTAVNAFREAIVAVSAYRCVHQVSVLRLLSHPPRSFPSCPMLSRSLSPARPPPFLSSPPQKWLSSPLERLPWQLVPSRPPLYIVTQMAAAAEATLGPRFLKGAVLAPTGSTRYPFHFFFHSFPYSSSQLTSRAFHGARDNLPDKDAVAATSQLLSLLQECDHPQNVILFLISGMPSSQFPTTKYLYGEDRHCFAVRRG